MVTETRSTAASAGAGSGVTALGFTVITGVPWVTDAVTVQLPAKTDWVVVPSAAMSVASVIRPDPSLTASRPAISLPSVVELIRTAAGTRRLGELGQRLGLRRHQIVADRRVVDHQHAGGAVLTERFGHVVGAVGEDHRDRLAHPPGQRQQLQGRLGDLAVSRSATTSTSDIRRSFSDVLAGGQEVDQGRRAGAVLVGDDLAGLLGRARGRLDDLGPGRVQPDRRRRRRRGRPASRTRPASSWRPGCPSSTDSGPRRTGR